MSDLSEDDGVIAVLLHRLETQRLPRALALKDKVDSGDRLDAVDMDFLEQVFRDAANIEPLVERHPEYQELVGQVTNLYKMITDKALENEQRGD